MTKLKVKFYVKSEETREMEVTDEEMRAIKKGDFEVFHDAAITDYGGVVNTETQSVEFMEWETIPEKEVAP